MSSSSALANQKSTSVGRYTDLTEDRNLPAVFHCQSGKDRTGIVAVLLLDALGVERDTILDDKAYNPVPPADPPRIFLPANHQIRDTPRSRRWRAYHA